jgi:hypothetical protein
MTRGLLPEPIVRRLHRKVQSSPVLDSLVSPSWAFSRTACLGNDTLSLIPSRIRRLNVQKLRSDRLVELLRSSGPPADHVASDIAAIRTYLDRDDVFQFVEGQYDFRWLTRVRPPKYIFIDTYSDLTDQIFVHRKTGFTFFCNYSDLRHAAEFTQLFECGGLLGVEQLAPLYLELASLLAARWPHTPIAFLSYPTDRERREKFLARADALDVAISDCCVHVPSATRIVLSSDVTSSICEEPMLDTFPYHYPPALYEHAAQAVNDSLRLAPTNALGFPT